MAGNRVALRFAKSLFDLAIEQNQLEAVFADMQLIESTAKQSHDLVVLFNSPVVATDAKKKIIDQVFKASVSLLTTSFLHFITTSQVWRCFSSRLMLVEYFRVTTTLKN